MFSDELPSLPLKREVEFRIESLILVAPYMVAHVDSRKLKEQLEDLHKRRMPVNGSEIEQCDTEKSIPLAQD